MALDAERAGVDRAHGAVELHALEQRVMERRCIGLRLNLRLGFRRDHADLRPRAPADDDEVARGGLAARVAVEESVGRAIIDLAIGRRERADRRKEREELERLVARQFIEKLYALDFRREHAVRGFLFLELDDAVLQHARSVDDAVERPELFSRFGERRLQRVAPGHVARDDEHLGPEPLPFVDLLVLRPRRLLRRAKAKSISHAACAPANRPPPGPGRQGRR